MQDSIPPAMHSRGGYRKTCGVFLIILVFLPPDFTYGMHATPQSTQGTTQHYAGIVTPLCPLPSIFIMPTLDREIGASESLGPMCR